MERQLALMPGVQLPTITLGGDADSVTPVAFRLEGLKRFTGHHENRIISGGGPSLSQEALKAFARAISDVDERAIGQAPSLRSPRTFRKANLPYRGDGAPVARATTASATFLLKVSPVSVGFTEPEVTNSDWSEQKTFDR
jgi:hypothetical protein